MGSGRTAFAFITGMGTNIFLRLFIIAGLIWCFSSLGYAQESNPQQMEMFDQNGDVVVAPVVLKPNQNNKESAAGVVIADNKPIPDNALDTLRKELQRLAGREHAKAQERGWFKSVNYRFTPESMTFFIAIGAVTFNSMWIRSEGDPLAMERHILALKDPIAHISFYSFMAANGFYIDYKTRSMDRATKAQAMRRLSYQGMAVGSLASSITSDAMNLAKTCSNMWLDGRNDQQSQAMCNQALKQWTVRNKFQQYFPQILHMWISQAATEVIDSNARKAFAQLTASQMAQRILSKPFLVKTAQKMVGVDALIDFSSGTPVMKVLKWSGKLVQFYMFVQVDHWLMPFTYRPLNNILKPMLFDFDALAINNFVSAADHINWNDSKLPEASKKVCTVREPNCLEGKILKEIESFGIQSQQWREHINSEVETDLAGWMEMTKRLLQQIDYSYKFYKSYLQNFYNSTSKKQRIESGDLLPEAIETITGYPLRTLPLNGVSLGSDPEAQLIQGAKIEDAYLLEPQRIEKHQLKHIKMVVTEFEKQKIPLEGESLLKAQSILKNLKSDDLKVIQAALLEINSLLGINSYFKSAQQKMYSEQFYQVVKVIRTAIGNPMPNVYPFSSFAESFQALPSHQTSAVEANFSLWSVSKKYTFRKEADLMVYQSFCGPKTGFIEDSQINFFGLFADGIDYSKQYVSPSVLKPSAELSAYCSKWRKTRDFYVFDETLYGQKIGQMSMDEYFFKNFDYSIFGDMTKREGFKEFDRWWIEKARGPVDVEFKKFDEKYKKLVAATHNNILGHNSYVNWLGDHLNGSKYLQKTLKDQLNFEAQFYLQIISRVLNLSNVAPLTNRYKFLETIVTSSKNDQFKSVYGAGTQKEIQRVWDLINAYYSFALQSQVDFNAYIAHSKKIDTAINDLLVLAGLKRKVTPPAVAAQQSTAVSADASTAQSTDATEADAVAARAEPESEEESADFTWPGSPVKPTAPPVLSTDKSKPSNSGSENSDSTYETVQVAKPTLRQKVILASVQGLRGVEGEIRRLIRMKVSLAKTLELDSKEYLEDFLGSQNGPSKPSTPTRFSPYGNR